MALVTGARSLETILTLDNKDADSEWSMVWSTSHVASMDAATGGRARPRAAGRRRLRGAALALGSLLSMHCRVTASALTGGYFVFILLLIPATALLANPLRHFEVYLGQWSISGPGRAFRIIPMLDGIGLAICINAIVRSIYCGTIAAIMGVYVLHGASDQTLPTKYCRDFNLSTYDPDKTDFLALRSHKDFEPLVINRAQLRSSVTVGISDFAWRNASYLRASKKQSHHHHLLQVCKETFLKPYPKMHKTPSYNFFYVEVMRFLPDYRFGTFNMPLIWNIIFVWISIWIVLIFERISYGRLIWNNTYPWFAAIPWLWTVLVMISGIIGFMNENKSIHVFKFGAKEIIAGISDAFEVAMYIHAASTGTELIHGKGLNHYAYGHIDPHLNSENVWHSGVLLLLTVLHAGGAALCMLVDHKYSSLQSLNGVIESTLWVIPMYSKCTSTGNYSHLRTTLLFSGLMFSYMTVAFTFLKSALHTIFEYRVKLVFIEQVVVGGLILTCTGLSLLFATNGGLPLLESIDSIMIGLGMPLVCLLQLVALLYVYRSSDFVSDMNVATEDNMCSTRIGQQWQFIPFIIVSLVIMKIIVLSYTELPARYMYAAIAPLAGVLLAVPIRSCQNAYTFLSSPQQGNK